MPEKPDNVIFTDLFGQAPETIANVESDKPNTDHITQGRYAEFIVCAYLSKLGFKVFHVDAAGFDLILEYDAASYRVDVKSTAKIRTGPFKQSAIWNVDKSYWSGNETTKRRRNLTPRDVDLLGLFHMKLETVVFYPVLRPINHVGLPLSFVRNSGHGEATLRAAIEKLNRRPGE